MSINADACYPWLTEVKTALILVGRRETRLVEKSDHERPKTAIDMKWDLVLHGQARKGRDVVNYTMGEIRSGTNQQDCVGIDQAADRWDVDLIIGGRALYEVKFETKVFACFDESGVCGIRDNSK